MQVVSLRVIDTRRNIPLKARLHLNIVRLRASRDYRRPLTDLPIARGQDVPGVVHRKFRYRSGRTVEVRLHAKPMVALMRAMLKAPTIEVTQSFTSPYSGSGRTYAQQEWLYEQYVKGDGHLAATPGRSFHETYRAVDLLEASSKEERAMSDVRVDGERWYHGDVFGDPPHWSFAEQG